MNRRVDTACRAGPRGGIGIDSDRGGRARGEPARTGMVPGGSRAAGMATAEFAVAVPAVVLVLVVGLLGMATAIDRVRCVDAARLAARSLARGDPPGTAMGLAVGAAPAGARVSVGAAGQLVTVHVESRRNVPILGVSWTVSADASAQHEGGVPP